MLSNFITQFTGLRKTVGKILKYVFNSTLLRHCGDTIIENPYQILNNKHNKHIYSISFVGEYLLID